MKKITSIFLICLTSFFVQAQELYRNETSKFGYKDTLGNIIIQPKYDKAEEFSYGLAAVNIGAKYDEEIQSMTGGKWGYIDSTGKVVIALKYEYAEYFSRNGFAVVSSFNDTTLGWKYGVIDRTGKEVVPLKYYHIDAWNIVQLSTPQGLKTGYLHPTTYKEIIPTKYDAIHLYQCGIASVVLNGKYGFVDQLTGKELVTPKYDGDHSNSFSNGLAKVSLNEKYFYIDKYGNEFAVADYYRSYPIRGYTIVNLKSQSFFIDSTGKKYSMNKNINRVYDIFENLAWVDFTEGGMGIIDIQTGNEIYKCNNCDVGSGYFSSNGLMELASPEPMYVDKNGKQYYPEIQKPLIAFKSTYEKFGFNKYSYSNEFKMYEFIGQTAAKYDSVYQTLYNDYGDEIIIKGYFMVEISNKKGLVDSLGNEVTPVKYDWIDYNYFGEEYTKVKLNGKTGLIDKLGKEVIAPAYYDVGKFSEGLAWVQPTQGGNFGYIDANGKLVIDTTLNYVVVHGFSDGLAIIENRFVNPEYGEEHILYGYIDKTGKEIIPLKYIWAEDFRNGKAKVTLANLYEYFIDKNGNEVK